MITPSQILITTLILFIIVRTLSAYKTRNLSPLFVLAWLVMWFIVLFFVFQQDFLSDIGIRLGLSRGVDLVIYVSIIVIFYVLYRVLIILFETRKTITQLVRKLALEEKEAKDTSK